MRAVLNPLFFLYFFCKKILHALKEQKAQKAQRRNQAKAQNANKRTKIKNAFKKHLREKSHILAYLRFCAFCAREEKRIEKREKSSNVKYRCSTLVCKASLDLLSMQM